MKKKIMTALLAIIVLGNSLTALAAPEIMPDGTVFDAEYYAQMYPDVVAVFGMDADALYQHYINYGRAEGRSGSANGSNDAVSVTDNAAEPSLVYPDYALVQDIVGRYNKNRLKGITPENKIIVAVEDTTGYTEKIYDEQRIGDERTVFMYFDAPAFDNNRFDIDVYDEMGEFCGGISKNLNASGKYNVWPVDTSINRTVTRMVVIQGFIDGNYVGYYSNLFDVNSEISTFPWSTTTEHSYWSSLFHSGN